MNYLWILYIVVVVNFGAITYIQYINHVIIGDSLILRAMGLFIVSLVFIVALNNKNEIKILCEKLHRIEKEYYSYKNDTEFKQLFGEDNTSRFKV